MLLAEELALVAIKPASGRHEIGTGSQLNACLAGLLVAELLLDGVAVPGGRDDRVELVTGTPAPTSPLLGAAAQIVSEAGPKVKGVLSHMSRGLTRHLGMPTWDAVLSGLVDAGVVGPPTGGLLSKQPLLDVDARDMVVRRLQAAAHGDGPIDPRTALVLSMSGPAQLLEVVAPERRGRRHARGRIDHALDGTPFEAIGKVVRRLIADAQAAAVGSTAAIGGGIAASS